MGVVEIRGEYWVPGVDEGAEEEEQEELQGHFHLTSHTLDCHIN